MNRRLFLSMPSVALVTCTTPAAAIDGETEILRLFREHEAILDAAGKHDCAATGKDEAAELELLFYQHSDKIEAEMMALPCTCAADFAAKMIVDTVRGGTFSDWEKGAIWQEARTLTGCSI